MKKIKIEMVADLMGLSGQTVRVYAQEGRLDFVEAIKRKTKNTYIVHPAKLAERLGWNIERLEEEVRRYEKKNKDKN